MSKERVQHIHKPSTIDIFYSLSSEYNLARKLLGNNKEYSSFLEQLVESNFHNEETKITIKRLAESFKIDTAIITKWLKLIYEDIFVLNQDKPELFVEDKLWYNLYFKNFDTHCYFSTHLNSTPRKYERFKWWFVKAKMEIDFFWVKEVEHEIINNKQHINITLEGGFPNKYREELLDRAEFEGVLGPLAKYNLNKFEIDNILRKTYKFR